MFLHLLLSVTYTATGVYSVTVTLSSACGLSSFIYQYVVVYDPSAGFVTGGSWITSPAGAYLADPAVTGRGHFGFVSRYRHGAQVPTGRTDFNFQAGNFSFNGRVLEWMVISGARVQYRGSGTVNGAGNYGFLLTAIDGKGRAAAGRISSASRSGTGRRTRWSTTTGAAYRMTRTWPTRKQLAAVASSFTAKTVNRRPHK